MNNNVINEIMNCSNVIDENIKSGNQRGLLAQNILSQMRNIVESVIVLIYNKSESKNLNNSFESKRLAYKYIYTKCRPRFICKFHMYLQASKSHYTCDFDGAEILMHKYFYYLKDLKDYVFNEFGFEILKNIDKYPICCDESLIKYYNMVGNIIDEVKEGKVDKTARYYIEKKKPFQYNNKIYYEITLTSASDNYNKFDRIIAYTKYDIMENYAIIISYEDIKIKIFDSISKIRIINNWQVAIRSCEFNNMFRIFGINKNLKSTMREYYKYMTYLTSTKIDLLDLASMDDLAFKQEIDKIGKIPTSYIYDFLITCRNFLKKSTYGKNTIRYLLYTMRNVYIKKQLDKDYPKNYFGGLCLKKGCFAFEKMPYILSLCDHTPAGDDLFLSLDLNDCEAQLLGRTLIKNIEQKGMLYTKISEIENIDDIDQKIIDFNKQLHVTQKEYNIVKYKNYLYMEGYEKSTLEILNILNSTTDGGITGYKEAFSNWEKENIHEDEISNEKKAILRTMFDKSRVCLLYGAAGTGKTTMIKYISEFFAEQNKLFLTNTNTALDNLQRRIKTSNSIFKTVKKLNSSEITVECDLLVIDEASTISNADILKILQNVKYTLVMIVGDVHQIESIKFGNWFAFSQKFVNDNSIYELTETFRSNDANLLKFWNSVRTKNEKIIEIIAKNGYYSELGKKIFEKQSKDEIVLCLGYDGLYGINQINKYLQNNNPNPEFNFGLKSYKVDDPVLFIDTTRFKDVLYNNLKGTIKKIELIDDSILFEIEIPKVLHELDIMNTDIELVSVDKTISVIRIRIEKDFENDDDDDEKNNIVPFNVAYALSIHKSQGLEYESVKVVMTSDVEKKISPNIFYTAITRAKKYLNIFSTSDTLETVVSRIYDVDNNIDINLFRNKNNL